MLSVFKLQAKHGVPLATVQNLEATWTICFKLIFCEAKTHPSNLKAWTIIS